MCSSATRKLCPTSIKDELLLAGAALSHPDGLDWQNEVTSRRGSTPKEEVLVLATLSGLQHLARAEQPQVPQPLPISLVLQTLHQLRCPSLDTLQPLNVLLVVRGPTLNTAFEPLFPKPVALHGVAVAQVQDPALSLVEPHTTGLSPSIQPVQVPLQSLPTLQQINTPAQLGVICKLTEGALDPFIQIVDKDVKQNWPQHQALGNTACDRLPTGVNSIHHPSLDPAIQPVLYPAKSTPVQAMSSQFLQQNAVGNRVKGFTEV
ncbi:hypothetical protein QYF61_022582 [Mycteria americana]|uniref:Uncharacterized protein n=1 Tax=Mycteria americana TaxID=33587 RepID=A0AAN7NJM2_MYCAM|nr:hypothetical protein QYF61_022582 [Mycteria americana]